MKSFKTVYNKTQNQIIIKKSKFISHIKPVETEKEAIYFINEIKSQHWNATHNVYAYSIEKNSIQRYSDDGEPKGTAGLPTLQTINGMRLTNVVIVTTRYFGGTLLGASGLIRAYRKSAVDALEVTTIVSINEFVKVQISIEYTYLGKVQNELSNLEVIINNIVYEDNVKIEVVLKENQLIILKKTLMNILSGNVNINNAGKIMGVLDMSNKLIEVKNIE